METSLTRRERERVFRRQEMLKAAQAVFAEKGYQNATLDEIAQRAEYGKGTLYNYFEGGKEEILFAVFDELYDDLCLLISRAFVPEPATRDAFRQDFQRLLASSFRFFEERHHLFMILLKEAHWLIFSQDPDKALYYSRQTDRVVQTLVPPLQRAMERQLLKPNPPPAVAHMILGNIKGLQTHLCMERRESRSGDGVGDTPHSLTPVEAATFLTTMLLDGLLAESDAVVTNEIEIPLR
jgi:TetR/AcrR family transcriptional regulator, repressor of fatR-cypB operon